LETNDTFLLSTTTLSRSHHVQKVFRSHKSRRSNYNGAQSPVLGRLRYVFAHLPLLPFTPCRTTANGKLEQALQSAYGSLASKCDLSLTKNHYGRTRYSAAWEQASDTGCRAWIKDSRRFWERGDRVCWRRGQGGQRGRRLRWRNRGLPEVAQREICIKSQGDGQTHGWSRKLFHMRNKIKITSRESLFVDML
jgi:hypothetical protein